MENNNVNQLLAEAGIKQFVRNVILETIKDYIGKPEKTEEVIGEINHRIMEKFMVIAKEESNKVFQEIKEKLGER